MEKYYVYTLSDPITDVTFYVGKGCGNRMYEHYRLRNRLTNPMLKAKIKSLERKNLKPVYAKVLIKANEEDCFILERQLIADIGRKVNKTGPLCNVTDGGEGASYKRSPEWCENQRQRMKGKMGNLKIQNKPVDQYSVDGKFIKTFDSAKEAGEQTTGNRSYITQVCKGKRKTSGGFLWKYHTSSEVL